MGMIGNLIRVSEEELETYLKDSTKLEDRVYAATTVDPNHLDLEKCWDILSYVITGYTLIEIEGMHPAPSVLFAGLVIDKDMDMGYGPAYYCSADIVKELSVLLNNISTATFTERYKRKEVSEKNIYPAAWTEEETDYVTELFEQVKAFYEKAAQEDQSVIAFIN